MIFLLFIFGLVLGSFLNVILFRFGTGKLVTRIEHGFLDIISKLVYI
jgi:prepilin signal peptidase PulO-like enzyme (type II secretory pathway)